MRTITEPVVLKLTNPVYRVMFNGIRDCNPFFHVAETVWMFSGYDRVHFVERFNKGYSQYAEPDGRVHGAYGKRWLSYFGVDQIQGVINILNSNPFTRQAVINMWDPNQDLQYEDAWRDRPCNTQVMFRENGSGLDMTIINRSNDLIWGALGANVVHFSYLHELIAAHTGSFLGSYRVVTNNLHVYKNMPRFQEIFESGLRRPVEDPKGDPYPLVYSGETWSMLHADCVDAIDYVLDGVPWMPRTMWMSGVALPMMNAYIDKEHRGEHVLNIRDDLWRRACIQWMKRREV